MRKNYGLLAVVTALFSLTLSGSLAALNYTEGARPLVLKNPDGFEQEAQASSKKAGFFSERLGGSLGGNSRTFSEIAQQSLPAVVSIRAVKSSPSQGTDSAGLPFHNPMTPPGDQRSIGIGSGVIIRNDGLILTSNHVVEHAEKIVVSWKDKHEAIARLIGSDSKTDVALLQLEQPVPKLSVIKFANSDQSKVGDWVIAVGNPFGLSHSVTSGIISAKGRGRMGAPGEGMSEIEEFIQTDAAINPGNSGGPLLNISGEMVGLNAAIFSHSGGFMGIGFAIPSNVARGVVDQLLKNGRVIRGWLGVVAQDLDEDTAHYFKLGERKGALISDVVDGGPAAQAAIRVGDVVLKFDNQQVLGAGELKGLVSGATIGRNVTVEVLRQGKSQTLAMNIREQPGADAGVIQLAGMVAAPKKSKPQIGVMVQDIPPEFKSMLGYRLQKGAFVANVGPGSPASEAGVSPGDVILSANAQSVESAAEFTRVARKVLSDELVLLHIQRGQGEKHFVTIRPGG